MIKITPYPISAGFGTLLALHGKKSGSLSLSGAVAAGLLGYVTLANPLKVFSVCLLVFYFSGSRATKVKAAFKRTLEEDEHASAVPMTSTKPVKPGGNRTASQVACNALLGSLCAVIWRGLYSGELADNEGWSGTRGQGWCCLDERVGWSRALVLGALAFWSACAGDTFASELGMLANTSPFLITTFRPVPAGTNGGVTPWGLLVSLLGGLLVGTAALISLLLENPACRGYEVSLGGEIKIWWPLLVLLVGGASGFVGSLIDSILGATLQESLYSKTRKLIVHSKTPKEKDEIIERIAGRPVLSNNVVNVFSSVGTALIVIWWARPSD